MMPLGLLTPGEQGEITSIKEEKECCGTCGCGSRGKEEHRVEDMGLRVGKIVQMLTNGSGPILLKVDESRLAISRGLAMKIMVKGVRQ